MFGNGISICLVGSMRLSLCSCSLNRLFIGDGPHASHTILSRPIRCYQPHTPYPCEADCQLGCLHGTNIQCKLFFCSACSFFPNRKKTLKWSKIGLMTISSNVFHENLWGKIMYNTNRRGNCIKDINCMHSRSAKRTFIAVATSQNEDRPSYSQKTAFSFIIRNQRHSKVRENVEWKTHLGS